MTKRDLRREDICSLCRRRKREGDRVTCDVCRAANNARMRARYVCVWAANLVACLRDAGMLTESARRAVERANAMNVFARKAWTA